jgi:hypothetical protein
MVEQKQTDSIKALTEVSGLFDLSTKQMKKYLTGNQIEEELKSHSRSVMEEVFVRARASVVDLVRKEDLRNSKKVNGLLAHSFGK